VVDGGGIIVKGNTLRATADDYSVESSVCVNALDLRNGGYFDVGTNTMSSVNGVILFEDTTVSSSGLLRVANCTFFAGTEVFDPALVYVSGSVKLEGGAQWRVEGNTVGAASVLIISHSWQKIRLSGSGTTVALAHNRQVDSRMRLFKHLPANTIVESPARFVVGCNLQGGEEVSYDDVFPEEAVVFRCGACNDDAACYMPGTEVGG
ncbi:dispersed gene family protein 1 (DGF-1), putative, partial [Trypanosoma cruzi marinkellei]